MSGVLYIVATPIGNLKDITLRAIEVLGEVDLIAAEDTRHSQQLLSHLGLKKNMLSVHEHNERERLTLLLEQLDTGIDIALISDAGTPLISDPGYPLVTAVIEAGHRVVPVPGVSSIITALSAAGLPTDYFCFHGFMAHKNAERLRLLETLSSKPGTHILFESTHRIERLLEQIDRILPQTPIVVAKELTKRHEKFIRGTAAQCQQCMSEDITLYKGEFVVLLSIKENSSSSGLDMNMETLLGRLMQDLSLKKAVKLAADITGEKKNELYQMALDLGKSRTQ